MLGSQKRAEVSVSTVVLRAMAGEEGREEREERSEGRFRQHRVGSEEGGRKAIFIGFDMV